MNDNFNVDDCDVIGPQEVQTDASRGWFSYTDEGRPVSFGPDAQHAPLGTEEASFEPKSTWGCAVHERLGPYGSDLLTEVRGPCDGGWGVPGPPMKRFKRK